MAGTHVCSSHHHGDDGLLKDDIWVKS